MVVGSKPDNSPRWHPPTSTYFQLTNVWITIAGAAMKPGSNDGTNNQARFNQPVGVAMDKAGNLFVTDAFNHTIRQISTNDSTTIIRTIAGTPGLSGTADGSNGVARFNQPTGIAVDGAGDLFVADTLNNTIREITQMGTNWVVTTIAGWTNGFRDGTNRLAQFNRPVGIAVDSAGILHVTDTFNHTIREIRRLGTNWVVKTIAGSPLKPGKADGPRAAARFNQPTGITSDSAGNLYVADKLNGTIRKLRPDGTDWMVSTIAGVAGMHGGDDGLSQWARFGAPCAISVDAATNLYVTDASNYNIRKMTPAGTNWLVATLGGWAGASGTNDGSGPFARFYCPCGIAVNTNGTVYYVADSLNNTIREGGRSFYQTNITLGAWRRPVIIQSGKGFVVPRGTFPRP